MTDWYKMNPVDWNDGTDDLTLEQEAAYLRICHAIYITERPIKDNGFVVAGLLRCNDRKAKRLVAELVEAGKLVIVDGHISNRRAVEEISNRNRTRMERKSAGSRGGFESGKSRSNLLKSNNTNEAFASTPNEPEEKRREENIASPNGSAASASALRPNEKILERLLQAANIQGFRAERSTGLVSIAPILDLIAKGYDLDTDILPAIAELASRGKAFKTWAYVVPSVIERHTARAAIPAKPPPPEIDWSARLKLWEADRTWIAGWGPTPGSPGCKVPTELLQEQAA